MLTTDQTVTMCELLDRAGEMARSVPPPATDQDRERLIDAAIANVDATVALIARTRQAQRPGWADRWQSKFEPTEPPPDDPEPEPDDHD